MSSSRTVERPKPRAVVRQPQPPSRSALVADDLLLTGGRALPNDVRPPLERRLGHSLARVRVHDDEHAAVLAEIAGADAFVVGDHIVFGRGRYDPSSVVGRRLIAHESAHVIHGDCEREDLQLGQESAAVQAAERDWQPGLIGPQPTASLDSEPAPVSIPLPAMTFLNPVAAPPRRTVRVIDLVLKMITRTLRSDPEDRAGRVRGQLARLTPEVRAGVLALAQSTLSASEYSRLDALLDHPDPAGAALSSPEAGSDPSGEQLEERVPAESAAAQPVHEHEHEHDRVMHTHDHAEQPHEHEGNLLASIGGRLAGGVGGLLSALVERTGAARSRQRTAPGQDPKTPGKEEAGKDAAGKDAATAGDGAPAPVTLPDSTEGSPAGAEGGAGAAPAAAADGGGRIAQPDAARSEVAGGTSERPAVAAAPQLAPIAAPATTADESEDQAVLQADAQQTDTQQTEPAAADADEAPTEPAADPEPAAMSEPAASPEANQAAEPPPTADLTEQAAATDGFAAATPEMATSTAPEPSPSADAGTAGGADAGPAELDGADAEVGPTADVEPGGPVGDDGPVDAADGAPAEGASPCAPDSAPPTPETDGPSGECASDGAAVPAPATPTAPDVSALPPYQALAATAALPPSTLAATLPQVGAAATADVGKQRDEQAPPTIERPSGADAALDTAAPIPRVMDGGYGGPGKAAKLAAAKAKVADAPKPNPVPPLNAPTPTVAVASPRIPGDQKLTEADAARVTESLDTMPVTDPELNVTAGSPEHLDLSQDADPSRITQQQAKTGEQTGAAAAQGAKDAAEPLGEANIRPHLPPKTLTAAPVQGASCPGLTPPAAKKPPAKSKHPQVAIDAIAAEKSGGEIRAGVMSAQGAFAAARDKRDSDVEAAQTDTKQKMDDEVAASNIKQVSTRRMAIAESANLRGTWTDDQRATIDTADRASKDAVEAGQKDIIEQRTSGQMKAQEHLDAGDAAVKKARLDAEQKARDERAKAKKKARGGILSWIGSKLSDFIDGLKAVTGIFNAARSLVRKAIDAAKSLAHAVIEGARKLVVGAIKLAGDAIAVAGDIALAAFPEARKKFRAKIKEKVDAATKAVNDAADALERGVQALLDALGNALDCALQYLEAGYLAAIDIVGGIVTSALDAAAKFIDMLADWAEIIGDIASDPMGWLRSLGRSAMNGIRCVPGAMKRAIKEWFNAKVEEVIGVGRLVINVLIKGCIKFADIAKMVWDGIKAALPGILIQLAIEKLVSLLIPAGAALSLLIDALRAGWSAASRILTAFQKFITFLKAVKSGRGAGAFAELVAAAGVAVLDFLSNFLVTKLKGAGKGVGDALKGMAQRIGQTIGRAAKAVGRGVRSVGRGAVNLARRGVGAVKRGAGTLARGTRRAVGAAGRGLRRVGHAVDPRRLARAVGRTRLGRAVGGTYAKGKAYVGKKVENWKKKPKETPKERLARAVIVIRPGLAGLLRAGASGIRLWAQLKWWQWKFGLSALSETSSGNNVSFIARVNPWESVGAGVVPRGSALTALIEDSMKRILERPDVTAAADRMVVEFQQTGQWHISGENLGYLGWAKAHTDTRVPTQPERSDRIIQLGDSASGALARFRRFRGRDAREGIVNMSGGSKYPEIANRAASLPTSTAATRSTMGHQYSAAAIHQLAMTGRLEHRYRSRGTTLAPITHLMYGLETQRRGPVSLAYAAMATEVTSRGYGDVSLLPQSPLLHGRAARYLSGNAEQRQQMTAGFGPIRLARLHAQVESLKRREASIATGWLMVQMMAEKLVYFDSEEHARQYTYDHLLKRFRLSAHAGDLASAGGKQ